MSQLAQALIAKEKEERTGYLDLGRCGLTTLPEELFDCGWLETLVLSNQYEDKEQKKTIKSQNKGAKNKLSSISARIKDLHQLKKLVIAGEPWNKWEISDISFLKGLKHLQSLYLSDNKISDISFLKDLQLLHTLYLSDNKISDYSFLKDLKLLHTLNLSDNKISDISFLKDLQLLHTLDLRYNKISDISFLKDLKLLHTLDLRYNKISDISFLKDLKLLHTLATHVKLDTMKCYKINDYIITSSKVLNIL